MAAWLVLAVGDEQRSYGNNDGYDDEPSQHYSWDSTVPNHGELKAGDVIVLRDKNALLGVSVIDEIVIGTTVKETYVCPNCGLAKFDTRKVARPTYKCRKCLQEFNERKARPRSVITYRSEHDAAWVGMPGLLSRQELGALCDSPKAQHSLRRIQWPKLREAIHRTGAATTVAIADTRRGFHGDRGFHGGHREALVRVRIGQGLFRRDLLRTHGETCAFTGPAPAAVLEAAHLSRFAERGVHHADEGLLLRRDLHRLFDLGLLAIHPEQLTIDVSGLLAQYPNYRNLQGTRVEADLTERHRSWLADHWELHRS